MKSLLTLWLLIVSQLVNTAWWPETLVGPMPEGRNIIRYETPEVFEALTKEWALPRTPRRRSRKTAEATTPETTDG
jgi:hypothetical protein